MKYPLSWGTAGLAAVLQFQCLWFGGAVSLKRNQPEAIVVRKLRADLDSRTEDLTQQKNIAHGLELEVRELQSELQAEKKALASESQKEQTLQLKLNRVRAVLDDAPTVKSNNKRGDKGSSMPTADRSAVPAVSVVLAPMGDDDAVVKMAPRPLEVSLNAPALQETVEAVHAEVVESLPSVSDSELESQGVEDLPPQQQALVKPAAAPRQLIPQAPVVVQEPTQVVHARQTTAQEPPPFFEAAAALQSASEIKSPPAKPAAKPEAKPEANLMTDLDSAMNAFSRKPAAPQSHAEKPASGAHNVAAKIKHAPKVPAPKSAPQHSKAKKSAPSPLLRGAERSRKVIAAPTVAKPVPAVPAVSTLPPSPPKVSSEANAVASAKDSDGGPAPSSDFDALEAQLHEEDRRIQDLDRENALDSMTDGALPAAPGSSPPPADKAAAAAQPKLEMDSEASMEDFLNVEAPGPDVNEAAGAAASSPTEASPADAPLAMPQDSADGALSDNQFLAQIAPAAKHA